MGTTISLQKGKHKVSVQFFFLCEATFNRRNLCFFTASGSAGVLWQQLQNWKKIIFASFRNKMYEPVELVLGEENGMS